MKRIITAIGNEKLNNILREKEEIVIESPDIQYQEGIFEALDKYKNIDIVVLNEDIIGNLELEDLIRSIIILRNDIEIILITEKQECVLESRNIIKVINNKNNYVDEILNCILSSVNIKYKKATNIETQNIKDYEEKGKEEHKENIIDTNNELKIRNNLQREKYNEITNGKKEKENRKVNVKENNIITVIGSPGSRKNNFYINTC